MAFVISIYLMNDLTILHNFKIVVLRLNLEFKHLLSLTNFKDKNIICLLSRLFYFIILIYLFKNIDILSLKL